MRKRAEEVPLKIYVQVKDGKTITLNRVFNDDVCYIRKDALLEWLENKIKIPDISFVNGLTYLAYQDVIDHLNSL